MDLKDYPADLEFRYKSRVWLANNSPRRPRPVDDAGALAFDREWQQCLHQGGWAGVNWPAEYGGLGLSGLRYLIWLEECARANAPLHSGANYTGLYHAGPTLIARGSDVQKKYHLPSILRGEKMWCQGFSEPGAGTDLAALRCRGDIDGEYIVVNGQKAWTTNGHFADFQELLVRTDPASQRHHGLTWIIGDMRLPGVTVRPVKTMMGECEVNDTFFDNVRIPIANVVGGIGNGWSVAMSTFAFERGIGFIGDQIELTQRVEMVIEMARRSWLPSGKLAIKDDGIAARLATVKAEIVALKALTLTTLNQIERNGQPGAEGSVMKLLVTTAYKALFQIAADILGPRFLDYAENRHSNEWTYRYLWSWVLTIAGGSNEIQRDIIADRILGLPRAR